MGGRPPPSIHPPTPSFPLILNLLKDERIGDGRPPYTTPNSCHSASCPAV